MQNKCLVFNVNYQCRTESTPVRMSPLHVNANKNQNNHTGLLCERYDLHVCYSIEGDNLTGGGGGGTLEFTTPLCQIRGIRQEIHFVCQFPLCCFDQYIGLWLILVMHKIHPVGQMTLDQR